MSDLAAILANLKPVAKPYAPWESADTGLLAPDFLLKRGIPHSVLNDLHREGILLGRQTLEGNPPPYVFDIPKLEEKLGMSRRVARAMDRNGRER